MLRTSICAVTEEFFGCSRSTLILPLNFVNFPCVVPRNWCTLKPIVDPDGLNLYVSFANAAGPKVATRTTAIRLGTILLIIGAVMLNGAKHLWLFLWAINPKMIRDSSLRSE